MGNEFGSGLSFSAGRITFTSKYDGKTVTSLVGSSVNFAWSFRGDVKRVTWGLKKGGAIGFENNGVLVSLGKSGSLPVTVPSVYNGRVSGSGNASSDWVIFTLSSIRIRDERFYGCRIDPTDDFGLQHFDSVYLEVKGEYVFVIEDTNSDPMWSK